MSTQTIRPLPGDLPTFIVSYERPEDPGKADEVVNRELTALGGQPTIIDWTWLVPFVDGAKLLDRLRPLLPMNARISVIKIGVDFDDTNILGQNLLFRN